MLGVSSADGAEGDFSLSGDGDFSLSGEEDISVSGEEDLSFSGVGDFSFSGIGDFSFSAAVVVTSICWSSVAIVIEMLTSPAVGSSSYSFGVSVYSVCSFATDCTASPNSDPAL